MSSASTCRSCGAQLHPSSGFCGICGESRISKKRLDALLCEYQVCHLNRDHYDGTRWIIGTIFIVTSFTLLGASFLDPVAANLIPVALIASVSLVLWFTFMFYDEHVQPWVNASLERAFAIEAELRNWGLPVYLHATIRSRRQISAVWIVRSLTLLIVFAWVVRLGYLIWHW